VHEPYPEHSRAPNAAASGLGIAGSALGVVGGGLSSLLSVICIGFGACSKDCGETLSGPGDNIGSGVLPGAVATGLGELSILAGGFFAVVAVVLFAVSFGLFGMALGFAAKLFRK
jgi:hypothetical protein